MRKTSRSGSNGFIWASVADDTGKRRTVARFTCRDCLCTLDITQPNHTPSPEWLVQKAVHFGWAADPVNPNVARCVLCQDKGKTVFVGHRQGLLTSTTVEPPIMPTKPEAAPVAAPEPIPFTPEVRYRELTFAQKREIRNKLDASFDDKVGAYLDGVSDQSIGADLDIPWGIIKFVRERDYGVILAPPEVIKAEQRMDQLASRIATMEAEVAAMRALLNTMRSELTGIRARYASVA